MKKAKKNSPYRNLLKHNFLILILIILLLNTNGCSRVISQNPTELTEVETTQTKSANNNSQTTEEFISGSDFLLNTVVTIQIYDKQEDYLLKGCFDLISNYEQLYSRTLETSELYSLNHRTAPMDQGAYSISAEMSDLLSYGLFYSRLSGGAFDLTIGAVSSLWNFTANAPIAPDDAEIQKALPNINYEYVQLEDKQLRFAKDGVMLDLGAIAKGYIADRVKEYLMDQGVRSAMINLGGNVLCIGSKPEGIPFRVGIQKPFADCNETIAVIDISDLSVVSSGVYERYFEVDGKRYHHILNPKTGYPYDNNLISVTIISKHSVDGDGLSTSCFALGLEKGLELISSLPDTYAVFITSDYQVHYSEGFEDAIKVTAQ